MKDYEQKHYAITMEEKPDRLSVEKAIGSNWCVISIETNSMDNGSITIRSRAMAEALHFMLDQMLKS